MHACKNSHCFSHIAQSYQIFIQRYQILVSDLQSKECPECPKCPEFSYPDQWHIFTESTLMFTHRNQNMIISARFTLLKFERFHRDNIFISFKTCCNSHISKFWCGNQGSFCEYEAFSVRSHPTYAIYAYKIQAKYRWSPQYKQTYTLSHIYILTMTESCPCLCVCST